jgi:hypothetical protein
MRWDGAPRGSPVAFFGIALAIQSHLRFTFHEHMDVITPPKSSLETTSRPTAQDSLSAWRLMEWLGVALTVMGLTDVALAWYPPAFGRPEWEFGAITASLNGFALPTLGMFFLLVGAVARNERVLARSISVVMFVLAVAIIILGIIYLTVVPLALSSVAANPLVLSGMKKAVTKAGILSVTYVGLFAAGGIVGWRGRTRSK